MNRLNKAVSCLVAISMVVCVPSYAGGPVDLLPDVTLDPLAGNDNIFDTATIPGRVLFRFRTSIPNNGPGPFMVESNGLQEPDGRFEVNQRIKRSDGTFFTRRAGSFSYNPDLGHMEAVGWVSYRIREITENDGIGPVLREGAKLSICLQSSARWSGYTGPPELVPPSFSTIHGCDESQGISVGWTDIYSKGLDQQWIDVTGLVQGEYWLEVAVDPGNHIRESDETNNVAAIKVLLDDPALPTEPDDPPPSMSMLDSFILFLLILFFFRFLQFF